MYIKDGAKELLDSSFKCNKRLADYLIYKCGIPLLAMDGKLQYCFANTDELKFAIENMPVTLKMWRMVENRRKGGK